MLEPSIPHHAAQCPNRKLLMHPLCQLPQHSPVISMICSLYFIIVLCQKITYGFTKRSVLLPSLRPLNKCACSEAFQYCMWIRKRRLLIFIPASQHFPNPENVEYPHFSCATVCIFLRAPQHWKSCQIFYMDMFSSLLDEKYDMCIEKVCTEYWQLGASLNILLFLALNPSNWRKWRLCSLLTLLHSLRVWLFSLETALESHSLFQLAIY